ncbi:MAG TPA: hypothetical protein VGD61_22065 [Pyrinomonadaceae bacterium]
MSTITKEQENEVRQYLFGQLNEADEESLELRLLTEPSFLEEFDTVVDEVTDQYVRNELSGDERKGFETSYLSTAEGQQKLRFASELLDRAETERRVSPVVTKPGFFDWVGGFWQSQSMRLAATAAAAVIIAGGIFLIYKSISSGPVHYAVVNLSISTANRAEGAVPAKVKYESLQAGVEAKLTIPESERGATDYRVKLVGGDRSEHDLAIAEHNDQTVTVKIPVSLLRRGSYALQIFHTDRRISGSYLFDIE